MWPSPCGNPAGNMCKAISPSGNPALYVYAALHVYRNVYTAISHSENPARHLDMAISPNGNPALNVSSVIMTECVLIAAWIVVHVGTCGPTQHPFGRDAWSCIGGTRNGHSMQPLLCS